MSKKHRTKLVEVGALHAEYRNRVLLLEQQNRELRDHLQRTVNQAMATCTCATDCFCERCQNESAAFAREYLRAQSSGN